MRRGDEEGGRSAERLAGYLLRAKCCPEYLIYDTQAALRLGDEKLINSTFCMDKLYKEILPFGQFCLL